MTAFNFDVNQYKDETASGIDSPIPEGNYTAQVIDHEVKETRANANNKYLKLTFQILEGEHKGRLIWEMFNFQHTNEKAQEIARKQLAWLAGVLNIEDLKRSEELLKKPLKIKVAIKQDPGYEPSNKITKFIPLMYTNKMEETKKVLEEKVHADFNDDLPF